MVFAAIVVLASFAAGFGAGRVKNAAKLAAVRAEIAAFESSGIADLSNVVASIKSKL